MANWVIWVEELIYRHSQLGVFVALLIAGVGFPIPEDVILLTAGVIAGQKDALLSTIVVSYIGVMIGDISMYFMGRIFGSKAIEMPVLKWFVTESRLRSVQGYYKKYGYWTIFFSRFLAFLRASSFILAGVSKVPFKLFVIADGTAALISVPFLVWLGSYFSDDVKYIKNKIAHVQDEIFLYGLLPLAIIFTLYFFIKNKRHASKLQKKSGPSESKIIN